MTRSLVITAAAVFFLSLQGMAQGPAKERIKSLKVAYFTTELNLSVEESQAFWPIYNAHETKVKQLRKNFKTKKKVDEMSDAEIETHVNNIFARGEKELALKKDFYRNLKSALPIRKIAKLPKVERAFKQKLLKRVRDGKGQGVKQQKRRNQGQE